MCNQILTSTKRQHQQRSQRRLTPQHIAEISYYNATISYTSDFQQKNEQNHTFMPKTDTPTTTPTLTLSCKHEFIKRRINIVSNQESVARCTDVKRGKFQLVGAYTVTISMTHCPSKCVLRVDIFPVGVRQMAGL